MNDIDENALIDSPSTENLAPARRALWDAMQHHIGGLINDRDIVIRLEEFIRSVYHDESKRAISTQAARRIAIDMLESTEFTNRIEAAIITRAVGIAKRATFELLESNEFIERLHKQSIAFAATDEFRARVMGIAWPSLSDNRRDELIKIVDVAEQQQGATCDHEWLGFQDDPAEALGLRCSKCGAIKAAPIAVEDVKEEIIEIDEAGKVTAIDSTVHTKQSTDIPPPQVGEHDGRR